MGDNLVVVVIEDTYTAEKVVNVYTNIHAALDACWEDYLETCRARVSGTPLPKHVFQQRLAEDEIYLEKPIGSEYSIYHTTIQA